MSSRITDPGTSARPPGEPLQGRFDALLRRRRTQDDAEFFRLTGTDIDNAISGHRPAHHTGVLMDSVPGLPLKDAVDAQDAGGADDRAERPYAVGRSLSGILATTVREADKVMSQDEPGWSMIFPLDPEQFPETTATVSVTSFEISVAIRSARLDVVRALEPALAEASRLITGRSGRMVSLSVALEENR